MNATVKTAETVVLLLVLAVAIPAIAEERFEDPQMRERYSELTRELRCPKCQNESIAESGAPISEDMRERVRRMMEEGASDEAIRQAMVERFGSFVSYRPEFSPRTWALWLGPFVLLVIGVGVVLLLVARNRARQQLDEAELSDEQRRRAEQWLRDE
ncbi:cytochrome c-type biogenesis protein [Halomonadaceae bacterium KBTZ08]